MRWRRYSQAQEAPLDHTHCQCPSIAYQHSTYPNSPRRPRAPTPSTTAILPTLSLRTLTTTPALHKKGKNTAPKESQKTGTKEPPQEWDPEDFSALRAGIAKANDKLTTELAKLRTGGRFNPELLENVRVHLDKESKTTHRIAELAQVIPKGGRSVMLDRKSVV